MEREQVRMAILKQEQTFRQQVHELHRLYHVQKQLMKQAQITKLNQSHAIAAAAAETKPKFEITFAENPTNHQQFYNFQRTSKISSPPAEAAAEEEKCDLELTLATGNSRKRQQQQQQQQKGKEVRSSNSDSGTAVSSTSTDSELSQFKDHHQHQQFNYATATAPVRFQNDGEMNLQPPWLNQCLSLRMA
uniref:Uncharacterized protein n=1 Tax=Leersia perrieri TaxID=77586 RepID=A0A0D9XUG4_9ORYZ